MNSSALFKKHIGFILEPREKECSGCKYLIKRDNSAIHIKYEYGCGLFTGLEFETTPSSTCDHFKKL